MKKSFAQKARLGVGTIFSPMLLLASKISKLESLLDLAVSADNLNLRALTGKASGSRPIVGKLMIATQIAARVPAEYGSLILDNLPRARGQLLQDIFAVAASGGKRNGTFVEVGVGNGCDLSNTYLLEKDFGWNGLLVEPNRSMQAHISACRNVPLETAAAASKSGMILEFEEVTDQAEFSRLSGVLGHEIDESRIERYNVTTKTLNEAFEQANLPNEIDFISIDTEGSELDIILGLNLDRYRFTALAIEHNFDDKKLGAIRALLLPRGYRQVFTQVSDFDAWFVHDTAACQFRL